MLWWPTLLSALVLADPVATLSEQSPDPSGASSMETLERAVAPDVRGWWFGGDVLIWKRRRVDERAFVNSWSDNARLLDTTTWTTPFAAGARLQLGKGLTPNSDVQAIGFFDDNFRDQTSLSATPGTIRQPFFQQQLYGPPTPLIGSAPALVELHYQSQIISVETNLRRWWQSDRLGFARAGLLIGPRYFSLREQFQDYDNRTLVRGADPNDSLYQTIVRNNLYGGQLGGLFELKLPGRLTIVSENKFAGFANVTSATNRLALQDGFTFFQSESSEERFSGLVDFRLEMRWSGWRWLDLVVGYQAMYFWNMTSAPDVVSFNLATQSKQNNELAFWVHGPTIGLEIRF